MPPTCHWSVPGLLTGIRGPGPEGALNKCGLNPAIPAKCKLPNAKLIDSIRIKPLFPPRIPIHMVAVLLPESRSFMVQKLTSAHPLYRLPRVKVRHNETQRKPVIRCKGPAIVVSRKQDFFAVQIGERYVCCEPLLGVHEDMARTGL